MISLKLRWRARIVVAVLLLHVVLLVWVGRQNSPVCDEVGHLAAGVHLWHFGQNSLYRVNPPLVRAIATVPVVVSRPLTDWGRDRSTLGARPEWDCGIDFIRANGWEASFWYFMLARWMCIPFSLVGGMVCYRWAQELYGDVSGLLALFLWCFCPNVIAWGATICPDMPAAAMGICATYCFWRWLRQPTGAWVVLCGVMLGIVELIKTTWIVLFVLWPVVWLLWIWGRRRELDFRSWLHQMQQLGLVMVLGVWVVNIGYGFDGTFWKLGDFTFISGTLSGETATTEDSDGGNRFRGTWAGFLPVPLPKDYVLGIDIQKRDFELRKKSFLYGKWKHGGWWYYYIVCAAFKVPLGIWVLGILAAFLAIRPFLNSVAFRQPHQSTPKGQYLAGWQDELSLLVPAIVIFIFVSSQTGFGRHFRYVLPAFPFIYIWASKVARAVPLKQWKIATIAGVAVVWSISSSLFIYPHSMSYFSECTGGPNGGHHYLIDANIDWGQDLFYLKNWVDKHPEAHPLRMAYRGFVAPDTLGIENHGLPPRGPVIGTKQRDVITQRLGPQPGWHAMSVDRIHAPEFDYFLNFEPVDSVGYSIYIYHITPDEANRVRRELRWRS